MPLKQWAEASGGFSAVAEANRPHHKLLLLQPLQRRHLRLQ